MNTECNGNLFLRAKEEFCKTGGIEKHTRFNNKNINPCHMTDSFFFLCLLRPLLRSSGHSFWLQIQRSRVRFSALPDFLRSSESGTGSTQPRECN
jgi:hypothetical protein